MRYRKIKYLLLLSCLTDRRGGIPVGFRLTTDGTGAVNDQFGMDSLVFWKGFGRELDFAKLIFDGFMKSFRLKPVKTEIQKAQKLYITKNDLNRNLVSFIVQDSWSEFLRTLIKIQKGMIYLCFSSISLKKLVPL